MSLSSVEDWRVFENANSNARAHWLKRSGPYPFYAGGISSIQTGGIWKHRLFVFAWTKNLFSKPLQNDGFTVILTDFPNRVLFKQKSEMTRDCCVFKFIWRSVPVVRSENISYCRGPSFSVVSPPRDHLDDLLFPTDTMELRFSTSPPWTRLLKVCILDENKTRFRFQTKLPLCVSS